MTAPTDRGRQHGLAGRRALTGAAAGAVAMVVALLAGVPLSVSVLVWWDVAALVFTVLVWNALPLTDAAEAARLARSEDSSRVAAEAMLLGAGTASLVAVGFTLVEAGSAGSPTRGVLTGLAVVSVVLSWVTVQTVYTLRYARLYYSPPTGGIDFHDGDPDYLDLAYLALTIGMTFQVSDTDLTRKAIRRTAIHHAVLSYVFGTVIVAVTINIVAGLLGR
jgi:uncharacterized membrane protein